MITGEPIPKLKDKGEIVFAGTINQDGILRITAKKIEKETISSQIIDLIEKTQFSKLPVQRIADRSVKYFIPTILTIDIISFIVSYFAFDSSLLFSLTTFISVLVVDCPCSIGLTTPTAVTIGIGRTNEYEILIKNGSILENAGNIDVVIFDKTGTIIEGKPEIEDIFIVDENESILKRNEVIKNTDGNWIVVEDTTGPGKCANAETKELNENSLNNTESKNNTEKKQLNL